MRPWTVDVEDYRSLVARDKLGVEMKISSYVEVETSRLLDLLDELEIRATCFVVGRLAEERPEIVRRIAARGHEIGSHGFQHQRMEYLDPHTFTHDLRRSITVLQDITGTSIRGFRAPAFSLGPRQQWAFERMAQEGIEYDSSVRVVLPFGIRRGHSMIEAAAECGIEEYPGIALGFGRYHFPVGGGGGMRFIPARLTEWFAGKVKRTGFAVPIYVHPYDLSSESSDERWPSSSWSRRLNLEWFDWVQHCGRSRVAERLLKASSGWAKAGEHRNPGGA